jgi:DNA anti-recombination protein RmuC
VSYAYEKKVMIVSPMSLFPMLQITVKALHNLKIENSIQDILKNVDKLSTHLNAFEDVHTRLGKSIGTVVNQYNASAKEFKKIDKDIVRLSGEESALDYQLDLLERPAQDE